LGIFLFFKFQKYLNLKHLTQVLTMQRGRLRCYSHRAKQCWRAIVQKPPFPQSMKDSSRILTENSLHHRTKSSSKPCRALKTRSILLSGLAFKHSITIPNSPGTIDPDYLGEIKVFLLNLGQHTFVIQPGDRIAQMVIAKYEAIHWVEEELSDTTRGEGGFGSSGVK
jgi:hypothetical protein